MTCSRRSSASLCLNWAAASLIVAAGFIAGCAVEVEAKKIKPPYDDLGKVADLQDFMINTVHERAVLMNVEPHNVSNYGLIGQLRGTGDCSASNIVRQYMIKEMVRRGFGDSLVPGYGKINPVDVLQDPNYALVRVDAFIPPGARKDDWIDAQVTCLEANRTTSLAHGVLFETDLKDGGADVDNPSGAVNTRVVVKGPIVVNPAYALDNPLSAPPAARESLRTGSVLFNAKVKQDRPIMLRLRTPQGGLARRLQEVINFRFQDVSVAQAMDEAIVNLYVPHKFHGDWQHFTELVRHMYLRNDPDFNVHRAKQLAEAAVKPQYADKMEDIAWCWEAIGPQALEAIKPLMTNPDQRVAYFAARAAAFIGDPTQSAENRLIQIAQTKGHLYRLAAVRTLGQLPPSLSLNSMVGQLLDSEMTLVRIEAYNVISKYRDSNGGTDVRIQRQVVAPLNDPRNQKFVLDMVPSDGPPLIYVSRNGLPRIALIGRVPLLNVHIPYTLMDNRLTMAEKENGRMVHVFFRDPLRETVVQGLSQPQLDMLIGRLGGMGGDNNQVLNFNYGEVIAILQKLVDANKLAGRDRFGRDLPCIFFMQEPSRVMDDLMNAPLIDVAPGGDGQAANSRFAPATPVRRPVSADQGVARPGSSDVPQFGGPVPTGTPASPVPNNGTSNAPPFGPAPANGTSNAPNFGGPATPVAPTPPANPGASNAPQF